jgi:hypothetical protein
LWLEEGKIETNLSRKPNSKVQYLLPDSAHPSHCYPGIIKSLAYIVVRIYSRVEDREKRLEQLKEILLARSCKPSTLNMVMGCHGDGQGPDRGQSTA